jgi:hypothetical protein
MVNMVSRLWMRVQGLGVPLALLVAVATAAVLWLIAIALGPWAVLFVAPSGLVFLAFFGAAFVFAIGQSRFIPRAEGLRFLLPILFALPLVIGSGIIGIRAAQFLNGSVFHMSDSFLR